mmetsp:Transcript_122803/g.348071  ORF Transcript_122803/g.348071 Transcript_122803/m.348071 type:complete len:111 (+) Transcript_122803:293-625(+)
MVLIATSLPVDREVTVNAGTCFGSTRLALTPFATVRLFQSGSPGTASWLAGRLFPQEDELLSLQVGELSLPQVDELLSLQVDDLLLLQVDELLLLQVDELLLLQVEDVGW